MTHNEETRVHLDSIKAALEAASAQLEALYALHPAPVQPPSPPAGAGLELLAAHVPAPGAWNMVPGSEIVTALTAEGEFPYCADIKCGAAAAVVNAWNGWAHDPVGHLLYMAANGGHADYGGNEVYVYDLKTLGPWVRETDPAPLTGPEFAPGCPAPSLGPPAFHTYSGTIFAPAGKIWVFGTVGYCKAGYTGPETHQCWQYDPISKTWTHLASLDGICQYARTSILPNGNLLVFSRNRLYEVDPAGSIVRTSGPPPYADYGSGTGALHPDGNYYLAETAGLLRTRVLPDFGPEPELEAALPVDQKAAAVHTPSGRIVFWDGASGLFSYDPATGIDEDLTTLGPRAPYVNRVYNKWNYLPTLDAFLGYSNAAEGLWLYKLP